MRTPVTEGGTSPMSHDHRAPSVLLCLIERIPVGFRIYFSLLSLDEDWTKWRNCGKRKTVGCVRITTFFITNVVSTMNKCKMSKIIMFLSEIPSFRKNMSSLKKSTRIVAVIFPQNVCLLVNMRSDTLRIY